MSVCGRFWRSTTLIAGILTVNVISVLGGLPNIPLLHSLYWTADRKGRWHSVWSSYFNSRTGLPFIWIIRLLLLIKLVSSVNNVHQIIIIHSNRYRTDSNQMSKAVSRLLYSTLTHLLCSLIQNTLFWTMIVQPDLDTLMEWFRRFVESGTVGMAPIICTVGMGAEMAAVGLALWYRIQSGKWQKFNSDLAAIFPSSIPI